MRHTGPWPAITGFYKAVIGHKTQLLNHDSAAFFIFGTATDIARRCTVTGITFGSLGTIPPNDFLADFYNARDCDVSDVDGAAACFARFGSAGYTAAGCSFTARARMTFDAGAVADSNILILRGQNLAVDLVATCVAPASGNPAGAMVRIAPPAGEQVDTVRLRVGLQVLVPSDPTGPDGKPYGLYVDNTAGFGTNIWLEPLSWLDHTTVASVYVTDAVDTARPLLENYRFNNVRLTPDRGRAVWLDKKSPVSSRWSMISVQQCTMMSRDASPAVEISGVGYASSILSNCEINDGFPTTAKPAAIQIGADRWMVVDNIIGCQTSTTICGFAAGVEVTAPGVTQVTIRDNHIHPAIPVPLILPAFVAADIDAPSRNISSPGRPTVRTMRQIMHPLADAAIASNVLTIRSSGVCLLGMAAAQTVNRIVSGLLPGTQLTLINNSTSAVMIKQCDRPYSSAERRAGGAGPVPRHDPAPGRLRRQRRAVAADRRCVVTAPMTLASGSRP